MSHQSVNDSVVINDISPNSSSLIISDSSFRNLYQIGFNSRNLTKTIAQNMEISEVAHSLIKHAKSNILTIRSYGPLLLGLVRLYDKKIKLVLEDALAILNQRSNSFETIQKPQRKKNLQPSSSKKLIIEYSSNILSVSPLQDTIFSYMNNNLITKSKHVQSLTPSKMNYELLSLESKEFLRQSAQKSISQTASKVNVLNSDNNINMMTISNQLNQKDDENLGNFFGYFDKENEILPKRKIDINFNYDNNFNNEFNESNEKMRISFLSSIIQNDVQFKEKKQKEIKFIKKNAKLEYDDEMVIEIDNSSNDMQLKMVNKLMECNKESMRNGDGVNLFYKEAKYEFLYPVLSEMEENTGDEMQTESKQVIDNLSRMSLTREDFGGIVPFEVRMNQLNDKIEEYEENEQSKDEDIGDLNENVKNNESENYIDDIDIKGDRRENKQIKELENKIKNYLSKSNSSINFLSLAKKVSSKNNESKSMLFYNLLLLSQEGEISLFQSKLFSNDDIIISE